MALHADPVDLLERDQELAALERMLEEVRGRSTGALAVVTGEAGAGKTELLRRFCERASPAVRVLWAACDALFTPRPLGPLLDIAEVTGGDLQAQVAEGAAPHDVALTLLRELGDGRYGVLVLEDLHWADEATLDVVRLVARRLQGVPALLVISLREEQLGRSHPLRLLLGELPHESRATRVEVPPLTRAGVAELAGGVEVDAEQLYERTGGNPFFVTEVLAAGGQRIPVTVRDAVLARAARLSPLNRDLLDALSVVPQRTEVWLLEALGGKATASLEECLASGILQADAEGVGFRHELARQAVEDALPPDRRVALHRRALRALADPPSGQPQPARLAHHAEGARDGDAVLRHAVQAAEQAAAVGAHREAAGQYARALRFADGLPPQERAALLGRFAAEGYLTDMRAECIDALAEAADLHAATGDAEGRAGALLLRGRALLCAGRAREAMIASEEAIAVLAQHGSDEAKARAYAEQAGLAMTDDRHDEAIDAGLRAIELATRAGDHETLVRALNSVGTSELTRGDAKGAEKLRRSLALARETGSTAGAGRAYINLAAGFSRRGEWATVAPEIEEGLEYCRDHGLEAWENCLLGARAGVQLAAGRLDDAAATAASALDRAWSEHASARLEPLCLIGLVRARRGDPQRWEPLDEALAIARADGSLQYLAAVAPARAEAAWLEGRPEAVEAETAAALALALERRDRWLTAALAAWRQRAGIRDELPTEALDGPFALELAGDPRRAAQAWERLGSPYEAALALAGAEDQDLLRQAHERLRGLGARATVAIVARRLRERGARDVPRGPHAGTRRNPGGLTGRELEVLALLVEGLRNADISRRLVLSEKTVAHHVSAILRKLEVRSRAQAAAEARRLGLLAH